MKKNIPIKNKDGLSIKRGIAFGVGGFVIVETLVAVALVLLAIPAALQMSTKGIYLSTYSKNQMIATYLAQEGIEYIRARRDYNRMLVLKDGVGAANWDDGFSGMADAVRIDPSRPSPIVNCSGCNIYSNPPNASYHLYISSNGFYSHTSAGNTATPFYRGVFVVPSGTSEYVITSVVRWNAGFVSKTTTLNGYISNWYK